MKANRASAADAAKHIKRSGVTFARLLNEGVIKRQDRATGYNLKEVRENFIDHLTAIASGRGGDAGEMLSTARARQAIASAEATELKTAALRGEYVRADVMRQVLAYGFSTQKEIAMSMAGKCADALVGLDRVSIYEILAGEVRQMLDAFSVEIAMPKAGASTHEPSRPVMDDLV